MVRIRHPNLFVDKCDGICKKLPLHNVIFSDACRNLFFIYFVHLGKKLAISGSNFCEKSRQKAQLGIELWFFD